MDRDAIQEYLDRIVRALEGIRDELSRLETPVAPPPVAPDPWPAITAVVLAVAAVLVAAGALAVAWRALGVLRGLREQTLQSGRRRDRTEFAARVRRYSELLGVEAVTGRPAARGDTAATLRSNLERRLGIDREPGALELLEEVAASRRGLVDLPRGARASANGLAAMTVEWSIDRWVADPDAWVRDHRERHRLRVLATRPSTEDVEAGEGDTRLS